MARRVGLPPSSLYQYVAGRSEVIAMLRTDAYTSLNDSLCTGRDAAPPTDWAGQWMCIARAFRSWAIRNPHQFELLYVPDLTGDPPRALVIDDGAIDTLSLVGTVLQHASTIGQLRSPTHATAVPPDAAPVPGADGPLTPALTQLTLGSWSALVGHIILEPYWRPLISDPDSHYEEHLATVMAGIGLTPPTDAPRQSPTAPP